MKNNISPFYRFYSLQFVLITQLVKPGSIRGAKSLSYMGKVKHLQRKASSFGG